MKLICKGNTPYSETTSYFEMYLENPEAVLDSVLYDADSCIMYVCIYAYL